MNLLCLKEFPINLNYSFNLNSFVLIRKCTLWQNVVNGLVFKSNQIQILKKQTTIVCVFLIRKKEIQGVTYFVLVSAASSR